MMGIDVAVSMERNRTLGRSNSRIGNEESVGSNRGMEGISSSMGSRYRISNGMGRSRRRRYRKNRIKMERNRRRRKRNRRSRRIKRNRMGRKNRINMGISGGSRGKKDTGGFAGVRERVGERIGYGVSRIRIGISSKYGVGNSMGK